MPKKSRNLHVMLVAGGTGGHLFPAIAAGRDLISKGATVTLITDARGLSWQDKAFPIPLQSIHAASPAGGIRQKIKAAFLLFRGFLQATRLCRRFRPDIIVGFGGYASVPGVLAAYLFTKAKIVVQEQNAVMGRANKALLFTCDKIALGFDTPSNLAQKHHHKCVFTGNPVRKEIAILHELPYMPPKKGDTFRILVMGGSQGAAVFNDLVPQAISHLPIASRENLRIHQQVPGNDNILIKIKEFYTKIPVEADIQPFFNNVAEQLQHAHLVICRAGASTLMELAAAGKPAILVPYPFAADNHQLANAEAYAKAGGGWVIEQSQLTPEILSNMITRLRQNPRELEKAAAKARLFSPSGATTNLVQVILATSTQTKHSKHGSTKK